MSRRVLLVEDNATNLELITYLLRAFGYEVACARDGAAGLEEAEKNHYDLLLTDILMPKMDGYELARRVRAGTVNSGTPIVAVTALAMSGDRERILAAGFDGYIAKPIDPAKFGGQIERFVKKRRDDDGTRR